MSVSVEMTERELVVRLRGRDRLLALSPGVAVPVAQVRAARVERRERAVQESPWLRMPGTFVPALVRAGSFGLGGGRQLWCVRQGDPVLVVELDGPGYRRVVLEVDDPQGVAREINRRLPEVRL